MKRKEIEQIAQKLAKLEKQIQSGVDVDKAEEEVLKICSKITSLDDMSAIDDAVCAIMEKS